MRMAKFIRSIGNCLVNNYGFDLYENENGTATIRPVKLSRDLPRKMWLTYDSIDDAEAAINDMAGEDSEGAQRVKRLIDVWHYN